MSPSICLGTAQFGMDYGVTNTKGQTNINEVKRILQICEVNNIKFLDTAQAYGDSEEVIGLSIPSKNKFQIISKLSTNNLLEWNNKTINNWEKYFQISLKKLKVNKIDSFLIHNTKGLDHKKKEILFNWLYSLMERKLIRRIGISIYSAEELKGFPLDYFQIIQLPLSIYDQRMLNNGTINDLINRGINIHVRSIFLQGLILESPKLWPKFISSEFKSHHTQILNYCFENKLSILDFSLGFIKRIEKIESAVIGINNSSHLEKIILSWSKTIQENIFRDIDTSWGIEKDLDPRIWKT